MREPAAVRTGRCRRDSAGPNGLNAETGIETLLARDYGVSVTTILKAVGPLPPEEARRRKQLGGQRSGGRAGRAAAQAAKQAARIARETAELQQRYLTAGDAAEELGISRFTMHEYLQAGQFPGAFQIGRKGRFWLVPRAAVDARKRVKSE